MTASKLTLIDPGQRTVFFVPHLADPDAEVGTSDEADPAEERLDMGPAADFNHDRYDRAGQVVSSKIHGTELHAPVLDLDFPAHLVPSKTPGHFHLYLDVAMSWEHYQKLLETMAEVGLLQPGYVGACTLRGSTDVRAFPETKKDPS